MFTGVKLNADQESDAGVAVLLVSRLCILGFFHKTPSTVTDPVHHPRRSLTLSLASPHTQFDQPLVISGRAKRAQALLAPLPSSNSYRLPTKYHPNADPWDDCPFGRGLGRSRFFSCNGNMCALLVYDIPAIANKDRITGIHLRDAVLNIDYGASNPTVMRVRNRQRRRLFQIALQTCEGSHQALYPTYLPIAGVPRSIRVYLSLD
ncbi:hypothetical protein F5146DRAFT_1224469 [Armillaria mellea]|nr:hypothetical protein F5146DRAFT_1224469 [Armillaria mellea]